jgi:hypothetical protein
MASAVKAIFSADSTQFQSELRRMEAGTRSSFRGVGEAADSAAHSIRFNLNGASREMLVVLRELGRGNWTRVPGSVSLILQYLGVNLMTMLTSVAGGVTVAGAAIGYFVYRHLKTLNEELDRTGKAFSEKLGDKVKANNEAMQEAARAAADFADWLQKLGETQETLANKTDDALRALRAEFDLMREIARQKGESRADELKSEQEFRQRELDLTEAAYLKQKRIAEQATFDAAAASDAAFGSDEAKKRLSNISGIPGELTDVEKNAKKYADYVTELQAKVDAQVAGDKTKAAWLSAIGGGSGRPFDPAASMAKHSTVAQAVGPKGQEEIMSLDQAQSQLRLYNALAASLPKQLADLKATQDSLEKAEHEAEQRGDRESKAVGELQKKRDELVSEIDLHKRYDQQLALADESKGGGRGFGLNAQQRVGAYAAAPPEMREAVKHLASIDSKISPGQDRMAPPTNRPPRL